MLALSMPVAAVDDDLGSLAGDDFSEELAAEAIDWRPIITHFYVQPRAPEADPVRLHFELPVGVLPGLVSGWEDLAPRVEPRSAKYFGQSFEDDEPVISGWRMSEDGTGFEIHAGMAAPPPASEEVTTAGGRAPLDQRPIHALLAAQEITIFVGVDVLMSIEDPEEVDEILRQFFSLDRFRLSIHLIDEDIEEFRAAPYAEPITNGRRGLDSDFWIDARDLVNAFEWKPDLRADGAYAIRVEAAVSGRVDGFEDPSPREVEGEIRVVLVDQAIEIDQLAFEEMGETDLFD
jgi:hypothetical protein